MNSGQFQSKLDGPGQIRLREDIKREAMFGDMMNWLQRDYGYTPRGAYSAIEEMCRKVGNQAKSNA